MIGGFMMVMRCVLTFAGAVALLFTLSYPDLLLPPNPNVQDIRHFNIYDLKPVLWVFPLLFMELVSSMGSRRNVVWFSCLAAVWIGGFIAWPLLLRYAPEWVEPTLPFEDGKLPVGMGYLAIIIFGSVLFRYVLLAYLFRTRRVEDDDSTMMEAEVLDPSKGRTVQQIIADPPRVAPKFIFGEADSALISRFYRLVHRLRRMRHLKAGLLGLAAAALVGWFWLYPRPTQQEALQRDLAAMYECRLMPDGTYRATYRAVHAAYRVMKYISDKELFAGKTLSQAERWLRVERAPEAYRKQLLDASDISLPSVDNLFESRTRFFTVTDGRRIAVLYIRTGMDSNVINIAEVQDAGWNAIMDVRRRIFGRDISDSALQR